MNPFTRVTHIYRAALYVLTAAYGALTAGFEATDLDQPVWLVFVGAATAFLAGGAALSHLDKGQ